MRVESKMLGSKPSTDKLKASATQPSKTPSVSSRSQRSSSMSHTTVGHDDQEKEKPSAKSEKSEKSEKTAVEHIEYTQYLDGLLAPQPTAPNEEVALLRTKVELLELRLEKLQAAVHVSHLSERLKLMR